MLTPRGKHHKHRRVLWQVTVVLASTFQGTRLGYAGGDGVAVPGCPWPSFPSTRHTSSAHQVYGQLSFSSASRNLQRDVNLRPTDCSMHKSILRHVNLVLVMQKNVPSIFSVFCTSSLLETRCKKSAKRAQIGEKTQTGGKFKNRHQMMVLPWAHFEETYFGKGLKLHFKRVKDVMQKSNDYLEATGWMNAHSPIRRTNP